MSGKWSYVLNSDLKMEDAQGKELIRVALRTRQ